MDWFELWKWTWAIVAFPIVFPPYVAAHTQTHKHLSMHRVQRERFFCILHDSLLHNSFKATTGLFISNCNYMKYMKQWTGLRATIGKVVIAFTTKRFPLLRQKKWKKKKMTATTTTVYIQKENEEKKARNEKTKIPISNCNSENRFTEQFTFTDSARRRSALEFVFVDCHIYFYFLYFFFFLIYFCFHLFWSFHFGVITCDVCTNDAEINGYWPLNRFDWLLRTSYCCFFLISKGLINSSKHVMFFPSWNVLSCFSIFSSGNSPAIDVTWKKAISCINFFFFSYQC